MPSNKVRHTRKMKRTIDKTNYKKTQSFCCDCDQPINKNCHKSGVMNGKCGRCYRMNFREDERRSMTKTRANQRKNQRKFKYYSQNF